LKIVTVSYSEIASYRRCPLQHRLQYVERWSKNVENGARGLGTRWHKILAAHYLALKEIQTQVHLTRPARGELWSYSPEDVEYVRDSVAQEFASQPKDDSSETLEWMYVVHVSVHGFQPHWTIIAAEHTQTFPLPAIPGSNVLFELKGIIDLIVQDPMGHNWIIDHKSSQNMIDGKDINFADQFGLYDWLLTTAGMPIQGDIIQFQKTKEYKGGRPSSEYAKHFRMDRTPEELEAIVRDAALTAWQAYTWPREALGDPPANPNPEQCRRFCDFTDAHLMDRRGSADLREYLGGTGFHQDLAMVDPKERPNGLET
jgi:hypothetical protein